MTLRYKHGPGQSGKGKGKGKGDKGDKGDKGNENAAGAGNTGGRCDSVGDALEGVSYFAANCYVDLCRIMRSNLICLLFPLVSLFAFQSLQVFSCVQAGRARTKTRSRILTTITATTAMKKMVVERSIQGNGQIKFPTFDDLTYFDIF